MIANYQLYLLWIVSLVSTLGSLFFSEVMKLPPCVLCWYQRIAMYPIAILVPLAILSTETQAIRRYVLALALPGFAVAAYHNLLYYKIIPENLSPCLEGISCTTKLIEWFGFVTIPLLSLFGFSLILLVLSLGYFQRERK